MRRRALLMGGKQEPNTIIGGVGSVITTKTALATKLGISESIIKRFEIIGNDVYARMSSDYSIIGNAFHSDSSITFFNDIDGKVVGLGVFCFSNSTIEWANFPVVKTIRASSFLDTNFLNSISGSDFEYIEINALRGSNISDFDFSKIKTIEGYGIGGTKFVNIVSPLLTYMEGTQNLRSITTLENFIALALEATASKTSTFRSLVSAELLDMRKLKVFGDPATNDSTFANLKLNCTIRVHIALLTSNSGAPDAALAWAKTNRSAIVEFYDDDGNYVSTL